MTSNAIARQEPGNFGQFVVYLGERCKSTRHLAGELAILDALESPLERRWVGVVRLNSIVTGVEVRSSTPPMSVRRGDQQSVYVSNTVVIIHSPNACSFFLSDNKVYWYLSLEESRFAKSIL
jgi:hypothetical protein